VEVGDEVRVKGRQLRLGVSESIGGGVLAEP